MQFMSGTPTTAKKKANRKVRQGIAKPAKFFFVTSAIPLPSLCGKIVFIRDKTQPQRTQRFRKERKVFLGLASAIPLLSFKPACRSDREGWPSGRGGSVDNHQSQIFPIICLSYDTLAPATYALRLIPYAYFYIHI